VKGSPELAAVPDGPQTACVTAVVRLLRVEEGSYREPQRFAFEGPERRVDVATRWELRSADGPGEPPLDDVIGAEWKGVWIPPSHREAVLRGSANRKKIQEKAARP
jgi:hypothetical protein